MLSAIHLVPDCEQWGPPLGGPIRLNPTGRESHCGRAVSRRPLGLVAIALCSLVLSACATTAAFRRGRDAEQRQDYDRAVAEYTQALRLAPTNTDARLGLERTRLRASQDHFVKGRRMTALGKFDEALVEYGLAAELNPSSADIDQELRSTRNRLRAKITVSSEGKTELQTLIDRSRNLAPPGLDLPQDVKMPASLTFREASSRDAFTSIARFANISIVFDSTFRETSITVDLRNASLTDALTTVAGVTRTFLDRKSTRLNSSHSRASRMPSSA